MSDNQPRYTTKRMHYEIDKATIIARQEALEEAAAIAEGNAMAFDIQKALADCDDQNVGAAMARIEIARQIRELVKAATPAPVPNKRATDSFGNDLIERELVSIVLRMSRHLLAVDTPAAKKLNASALDYLQRKGLMPSPLRAEAAPVENPCGNRGDND